VLLRLVKRKQAGLPITGNVVLDVSGQELAELSDTTVFSVSRAISAWTRAGIVKGGRRRVTVLNPSQLSAIAEEGQLNPKTSSDVRHVP